MACANPPPPEAAAHLEAALISPFDVALEWRPGAATEAAGRIVEFASDPDGEYTTLEFLPPGQTRFTHPDLVPETTFYYRVRPYYGPASNPVAVTLADPRPGEDPETNDQAWARPRGVPAAAADPRQPLRGAGQAAATPTDLRATVRHSSGILFTWKDHASDEDGFLLEAQPEGGAEFRVVALLDPDVSSFGLIRLPNERRAVFRVRAFYYGEPSNLARQTTGPDPFGKPRAKAAP